MNITPITDQIAADQRRIDRDGPYCPHTWCEAHLTGGAHSTNCPEFEADEPINAAIFTVADAIDAPAIDSLLDAMMTACEVSRDCGPIAWHDISLVRARGEISDGADGTRVVAIDMTALTMAQALIEVTWACYGDRAMAADRIRDWVIEGTPVAR